MKKLNFKKIRDLLKILILCFALISIGYMLGKNGKAIARANDNTIGSGDFVAVYYLHSSFRCESCNAIERQTKELLDREYTAALNDGLIEWKEIDFMENKFLARTFEVAASCVVVAKIRDGRVEDYRRLDEVWTLLNDPVAFDAYIRSAIEAYLDPEEIS